ncbi:MAG TPA: hypothetical protein VEU96_18170 [Bryobacteraceae bacterium]|nr:hypothetical protein [Bryobacteraceae bacterium]
MRILGGLCFTTVLLAQQQAFQNLAPNSDGSAVYFSSPLRMKGTDQYPSQPKIFIWDSLKGVALFEQQPPTIIGTPPFLRSATAYNRIAPSIGSAGHTVAITGISDCNFSSVCGFSVERLEAEIRVDGGDPLVMKGAPSVSANGRFVALSSPVVHPFGLTTLTVLDLATGQQQHPASFNSFPRRHGVANDGSVIVLNLINGAHIQLWRWSGALEPLNLPFNPTPPEIDAFGDKIFYLTGHPPSPVQQDLMVLNVTTGQASKVAIAQPDNSFDAPQFDISDDGSLVAFTLAGQAWMVHSDGTALTQITNGPDSIVEIALSGSGSHLFAITSTSRILRVDLRTMVSTEIVPATPIAAGLRGLPFVVTPGEILQLTSTQPIPEIPSVNLFNKDLMILREDPSGIDLQLPFDLPTGAGWPDAVLRQQSSGPFESAMMFLAPVVVASYAPHWFLTANHVAALHQDFSGPITPDNPAHPGEIVHAYGSGFGPVAPLPAPGQPASANPLSITTTPFICGLTGNDSKFVAGDTLFAGLAPGWFGLYQFDVRLPARPAGPDPYLTCFRMDDFPSGPRVESLLPMAAQ